MKVQVLGSGHKIDGEDKRRAGVKKGDVWKSKVRGDATEEAAGAVWRHTTGSNPMAAGACRVQRGGACRMTSGAVAVKESGPVWRHTTTVPTVPAAGPCQVHVCGYQGYPTPCGMTLAVVVKESGPVGRHTTGVQTPTAAGSSRVHYCCQGYPAAARATTKSSEEEGQETAPSGGITLATPIQLRVLVNCRFALPLCPAPAPLLSQHPPARPAAGGR